MNLLPYVVIWGVLATIVIVLAIYRRLIAPKEIDQVLHVDAAFAARQEVVAKRLSVVDRWGKILTVLAVVYAVVLVAVYLYQGWQASNINPY
jgi:hypothetical protein